MEICCLFPHRNEEWAIILHKYLIMALQITIEGLLLDPRIFFITNTHQFIQIP